MQNHKQEINFFSPIFGKSALAADQHMHLMRKNMKNRKHKKQKKTVSQNFRFVALVAFFKLCFVIFFKK